MEFEKRLKNFNNDKKKVPCGCNCDFDASDLIISLTAGPLMSFQTETKTARERRERESTRESESVGGVLESATSSMIEKLENMGFLI